MIDEATSSLDASSALECIAILEGLARAGATIITSLHQPSSSVFELIDYVIVMKHGRYGVIGFPKERPNLRHLSFTG